MGLAVLLLGIYLDDDQSGTHVYGNIVARTYLGGSHIHAGRDNVLENNIFVEGKSQQMEYSGHNPKSHVIARTPEIVREVLENPAYAKYPEVAKATWRRSGTWRGTNSAATSSFTAIPSPSCTTTLIKATTFPSRTSRTTTSIWHFGLPLEVAMKGLSHDKSWDEWRKRGFDTHSVVADPLFVAPEKDDYR